MNYIIAVRTSAAAALVALSILPLSARAVSRTYVYMLQGEPVPIFRTCDYTAIGSCDSYRSGLR